MIITLKGWKYNTKAEGDQSIINLNSYFDILPPMVASEVVEGNYGNNTFYYIAESSALPMSELLGETSDIIIEQQNI